MRKKRYKTRHNPTPQTCSKHVLKIINLVHCSFSPPPVSLSFSPSPCLFLPLPSSAFISLSLSLTVYIYIYPPLSLSPLSLFSSISLFLSLSFYLPPLLFFTLQLFWSLSKGFFFKGNKELSTGAFCTDSSC